MSHKGVGFIYCWVCGFFHPLPGRRCSAVVIRSVSGFTLIEVLVAVAILSTLLLASARNSGSLVNNAIVLEEKTISHWVARNKAAEIRSGLYWPSNGTGAGVTEMAHRSWRWQISLLSTSNVDLFKATISARPENEELSVGDSSLTFFVKRPR